MPIGLHPWRNSEKSFGEEDEDEDEEDEDEEEEVRAAFRPGT